MKIVLLVAFAIVAVILILAGYSWLAFRRVARSSFAKLPSSISLVPTSADWKDAAKVTLATEELERYRFSEVGRFMIPEFGIMLRGFVNQAEQIVAMIYEHPMAGVWTDLVVQYENGEGLTVSNALHGDEIDSRPGQTKIINPDLETGHLVRVLFDFVHSIPRRPVTPENFVAVVTEAYFRDYEWRKSRGGTTVREVAKVLERMERDNAPLPCGERKECPYETGRCSERDIEGMPFPESRRDPRACPTYGHICPAFMEQLGLTPEDLAIRATIHCGNLAQSLVRQGKLKNDSREYVQLMARYNDLVGKYPRQNHPKYY